MNNIAIANEDQNLLSAQLSLDVITLLVALAFKWEKIEYTERIKFWVEDFTKSLTDEEKNDFQKKAKQLGLI